MTTNYDFMNMKANVSLFKVCLHPINLIMLNSRKYSLNIEEKYFFHLKKKISRFENKINHLITNKKKPKFIFESSQSF